MNNNESIKKELEMLVRSLTEKRDILSAVVNILAENKKAVDAVAAEAKQSLEQLLLKVEELDTQTQENIKTALEIINQEAAKFMASLKEGSAVTKAEVEKLVKAQNDRAFKRLQTLISNIKLPKDGKDGKDADPSEVVALVMEQIKFPEQILETAASLRDKLETLEGDERLDWKSIKGLPDYFKMAKRAGRQMLVGGIRFFENLADVSIITTKKRQDLLAQYKTTNNRWENGIALTVSTTAPTSPEENDVWIDSN